jgi:hypothetical protein
LSAAVWSQARRCDSTSFAVFEVPASGPPGSSVEWIDGTGLRLSIRNGFMPNSKEVVSYHVGDWTFESCEEVGSL